MSGAQKTTGAVHRGGAGRMFERGASCLAQVLPVAAPLTLALALNETLTETLA